MAISAKDCLGLFHAKRLGVSFKDTLMLGRLKLNVTKDEIERLAKFHGISIPLHPQFKSTTYSEPFFKLLGAETVDSLDNSDYEGANIIHDMNTHVGEKLYRKYSCIVDGGTLEHIFNFPVAIANVMKMLKEGGIFIGISPANNQMGHGFYQFSPELYYSIFSEENGFKVIKMYITTQGEGGWFEVANPRIVKSRVMVTNSVPLVIFVVAKKEKDALPFNPPPQQSDYEYTWKVISNIKNNEVIPTESKAKFLYRKYVPKNIKKIIHFLYDLLVTKKVSTPELGELNPKHFKRIEF